MPCSQSGVHIALLSPGSPETDGKPPVQSTVGEGDPVGSWWADEQVGQLPWKAALGESHLAALPSSGEVSAGGSIAESLFVRSRGYRVDHALVGSG
jgi:hypothetical protein